MRTNSLALAKLIIYCDSYAQLPQDILSSDDRHGLSHLWVVIRSLSRILKTYFNNDNALSGDISPNLSHLSHTNGDCLTP